MSLEDACPELADDCGTSNLQAQKKEINILIVLDKSGSMRFQDSGGTEKWAAMKSALENALRDRQDDINFGLTMYPFPEFDNEPISPTDCGADGNCCEMPNSSDPQVFVG
jgi:hypothetical protein